MFTTKKCGRCGRVAVRKAIRLPDGEIHRKFYCQCGYYLHKGEWIEFTDEGSRFTPGHSLYQGSSK